MTYQTYNVIGLFARPADDATNCHYDARQLVYCFLIPDCIMIQRKLDSCPAASIRTLSLTHLSLHLSLIAAVLYYIFIIESYRKYRKKQEKKEKKVRK